MSKINWLHLSDIHFNYKNYESEWLRDSIVKLFKNKQCKYDFLTITGDLLFQFGSKFDEVKEFLLQIVNALGVSLNDVFIVPGNHDFMRSDERKFWVRGIKSSDEGIKDSVANLKDDMILKLINGQDMFWKFHAEFLDRVDDYNNVHFVNRTEKYNIINLNTCLISAEKNEEGSLSINMSKLRKVLKSVVGDNKPNIAIGHHSLECFNPEEREEIVKMFEDYDVDIYFCGHMHQTKYIIHPQGKRMIRTLVCGANMVDSYAEPSFISGEIDLSSYECSVKYYAWSDKRKEWIVDNEVDRSVLDDGSIKFPLDRLIKLKEDEFAELEKEIEEITKVDMKESKFQRFLIDFCKNVQEYSDESGESKKEKDVEEKFANMKCNRTLENEFNCHVEYFTLIDNILSDPAYISYDRKVLIPGVIISTYSNVLDSCVNGNEVINKMVELLCTEYRKVVNVPLNELQEYFKTIIFWSINKCDIYNEIK